MSRRSGVAPVGHLELKPNGCWYIVVRTKSGYKGINTRMKDKAGARCDKTFRLMDIQALLNEKGIAIFDTATAVQRLSGNASDKDLQIVEKTDIPALLERIPLCHDIVCTGQKSFSVLTEDYGVEVPKMGEYNEFVINELPMRLWRMPSSSRAYPMPIKEKAAFYQHMMELVFGD